MMLFTSDMRPIALAQNNGTPMDFKCDFCSTHEQGVKVQPSDSSKQPWAVLPEGWSEIEDRREAAKKQFPLCCGSGDCLYEAEKRRS